MVISDTLTHLSTCRADVCVVGAGPVGLILAVALARRGIKVVLLEAGLNRPDPAHQRCADATIVDPNRHAEMRLAVARAFGGTGWLWGGRCVPLDAVDFEPRPHIDPTGWPISDGDIARYYEAAADLIGCKSANFNLPPLLDFSSTDTDIDLCTAERWCDEPNVARWLAKKNGLPPTLQVVLDATVVDLERDKAGSSVAAVHVASATERVRFDGARIYVLACGGLETTRLLLHMQEHDRGLFGGADGPLGRFYIGHMSGTVARIRFNDAAIGKSFAYVLADGGVCRRRIVFTRDALNKYQLPNVAFYPVNPLLGDPEHRSGLLSSLFLLLSMPVIGRRLISEAIWATQMMDQPRYVAHLRNVLLDSPAAIAHLLNVAWQRLALGRRKPFVFLLSKSGDYPLHYHGEHVPTADSRAVLGEERDAMGMRRLKIDLRFGTSDAEAIARSHIVLDSALRRIRLGALLFDVCPGMLADAIMQRTSDGFHQIGLTRMAQHSADGVVDADCKVFSLQNLFIASSSVFRTAGQANPTFSAVGLGLRLADHLASVMNCGRR